MEVLAEIGYQVGVRPMVNCLLYLHWLLPPNFGLTIVALALLVQAIFAPLTVLAVHSRKTAAWLTQTAIELEQKQSPGDVPETPFPCPTSRRAFWVDPLGLINRQKRLEVPIWTALVFAIWHLASSLEEGAGPLAADLYPWLHFQVADLSDSSFLWMDMGAPDLFFLMPVFVFTTRLATQIAALTLDGGTRPTLRPLSFWLAPVAFSTAEALLPSGVALYWIVSWVAALAFYAYGHLSYTPPRRLADLMPR